MINKFNSFTGIPVSTSLQTPPEEEKHLKNEPHPKNRILRISFFAIVVAACISVIARFLVDLIYLVTHISFFGEFSTTHILPQDNHLGWWVIFIPAIGGVIIGFMALYGSKAIRGHGIPEAMEQILTNDSKIKPTITYLKPLSSAIAIGTGGPFGAEGPIIATGGALGSTLGQVMKISHNERKILLAAGATAGMAAIFGSPVAAIFLAVELLLFEFSPASIIPVALACITGAAGHHVLFDPGPVFPIAHEIAMPGNQALFLYSMIGLAIGLLSILVTKIVYWLEDHFEKLSIHWMWWPAIGGLFVGIIGYIDPRTLGVGYNNITDVLAGTQSLKILGYLCLFKFLSWSVALASGTSGGTLAPLLTIGGAAGAVIGIALQKIFPGVGISISLAALVGMSAMFAGASRAFLTSIIFALETTGQFNALLPLLAACSIAYLISFFLMENTIMTEKIARRGIKTPETYTPDILEQFTVQRMMNEEALVINDSNSIAELRAWLKENPSSAANYYLLVSEDDLFSGVISASNLWSEQHPVQQPVSTLVKRRNMRVRANDTLKTAVQIMAKENLDLLPVVDEKQEVIGSISYRNIMDAYKITMEQEQHYGSNISIKRQSLKLLAKGQRLVQKTWNKD